MPVLESLTKKVISAILKIAGDTAWKAATRNDKMLKVLQEVGLAETPAPDFQAVYAHALVNYGLEQPAAVLDFFRHDQVRESFRKAFDNNDPAIFIREADTLIRWETVGEELRRQGIDPRVAFSAFSVWFQEMFKRSRTLYQVNLDNKLDRIMRLDRDILELVKKGDLEDLRAKNLEMIQGDLSERLVSWFDTLDYQFTGHAEITSAYHEWIIQVPARRGYDSILVRCMEEQAEREDILALKEAAEKQGTDEAWLVAAFRKSPSACRLADTDDKVFCYTFDDLLDQQVDFTKYFKWLKTYVKDRRIDTDYVPLACKRDIVDENTGKKIDRECYDRDNGWMEGYIEKWLQAPDKEHISILGEFGTGKTWFVHHFAFQKMQEYLEKKQAGLERPRVPLVIHLRDYAKALNCKQLFSDFFFRKHEIRTVYPVFEQLNRMGKLLLIFDGFDEMANKLDLEKMIYNFWDLASIVVPGSKAILTSRIEQFPEDKKSRALLNAELKASVEHLTGDPPQFEILELEKFDHDQIRQALLNRADEKKVDFIMGHPELIDMAARPVMLDFILEALPEIRDNKPVDLSRIYLYACKAKLDRDIEPGRTFTSMADKLYFMCEISHEMLVSEKMSLNYREFPDRLQHLFGPAVAGEKDRDHWKFDMMGNSLLTRNDDGDYSPAHKSLPEFFVACKMAARLGVLPADFVEAFRQQSHADFDKIPVDYTWNGYFQRTMDPCNQPEKIAPLKNFLPRDPDDVLADLARMSEAVLRFLHEITGVPDVCKRFHAALATLLEQFKDGTRKPEKEQDILVSILKFRRLSQQWEHDSGESKLIQKFWKKRLESEISRARDKAAAETITFQVPSGKSRVEFEMVKIPAGSFLMGDDAEGPIHQVEITKPFLIAATPVAQKLYEAVMRDNPSHFKGNDRPVEQVNWFDVVRFCNRLSQLSGIDPAYHVKDENVSWIPDSRGFRLPTEAEWEYACRAGTSTRFACGDSDSDLEKMAWYDSNSRDETRTVGTKSPNAWGLYDMHGNVFEWCWDVYGIYPNGPATDPRGSADGSRRVVRGGSWFSLAGYCRSAYRDRIGPRGRNYYLGFRLVLLPGQ